MIDTKIDTNKIHLNKVKIAASYLKEENISTEVKSFRSSFNFSSGYNLEKKRIKNTLSVEIKAEKLSSPSQTLEAGYTMDFIFEVDNLEELSTINEDSSVAISEHLAATLAGICYSTLRGIVLAKTQGTSLNGILLPVLDPYSLLKMNT
jgi:hypothetical protein